MLPGRATASVIALAQFGAVAVNAVSRQVVQNLNLKGFGDREVFDVLAQPVRVEWSPLILFLVLFVAGLGVIGWMIAQAAKAPAEPAG